MVIEERKIDPTTCVEWGLESRMIQDYETCTYKGMHKVNSNNFHRRTAANDVGILNQILLMSTKFATLFYRKKQLKKLLP